MKASVFTIVKFVFFLLLIALVIIFFSMNGLVLYFHNYYTPVTSNTYTNKFPVIVIDAGHGGEDGGAEANGLVEKNINLSVANYLNFYLSLSDVKCDMTRKEDVLLYNQGEEKHKKRFDILNRVKFAEKYDDAIFVSIHQNKFEIPKYKGLQVYYSKNKSGSRYLAELIQNNSRSYLDRENKREIKPADYRIKVLDMLKIPAVLIECGFLSNPEEAKMLGTDEYQKKIAFVTFLSLAEYLNNGDNNEE